MSFEVSHNCIINIAYVTMIYHIYMNTDIIRIRCHISIIIRDEKADNYS